MWTMDELVERVRESLAAEYTGAPNGRVRDLPDRRAIRWYTTIGLVDRPIGMRGRTALYGPRHLLQLVALKRRQAELAGAPDEALTAVARVPPALLAPDGPPADQPETPERTRFWAADAFRPDIVVVTAPPPRRGAKSGFARASAEPDRNLRSPTSRPPTDADPIGGVALGGGAILVLSHIPTGEDRAAIAAAAEPLLAVLQDRGLLELPGSPSSASPHVGKM